MGIGMVFIIGPDDAEEMIKKGMGEMKIIGNKVLIY
jgi:hypothetical protein